MEVLRSFVIRIYRSDAEELAGLLEVIETGESRSFRTAQELCSYLASSSSGHLGSACRPVSDD